MDWPVLEGLDEADRRRVLEHARRRRFARNEIVFHEGDPGDTFHLIAKGRLAVRVTTPLGDVATLAVLGPGDVFGELALLSPEAVRTATIVALEPAETLSVHHRQFEELRRAHPTTDRLLVQILAAQVKRLTSHLLEALYVPVDTRLARRLLALCDSYGGGPGTIIPLTQEDLASMAGTTRPTANRVLRDLETAGGIELQRGRLTVTDPDVVARMAR